MAATNQRSRYLTPEEAAAEYGYKNAEMLRRAASRPGGPPSIKLGRLIRFDRAEMDEWMQSQHR